MIQMIFFYQKEEEEDTINHLVKIYSNYATRPMLRQQIKGIYYIEKFCKKKHVNKLTIIGKSNFIVYKQFDLMGHWTQFQFGTASLKSK